jgi:hypothetical protein
MVSGECKYKMLEIQFRLRRRVRPRASRRRSLRVFESRHTPQNPARGLLGGLEGQFYNDPWGCEEKKSEN